MINWYNNLTAKKFMNLYKLVLLLPMCLSLGLSFTDFDVPFGNKMVVFMLPALALVMVRRYTHSTDFPKMQWTITTLVAGGILLIFFGLKIVNSY